MISKQKVTVVATGSATLCLLWIKFGSQCSVPSMPLIYYKANQRCCSLHHTSAVMCLCSSKITVQPIPAENKIDNIQQKPLLRERQDFQMLLQSKLQILTMCFLCYMLPAYHLLTYARHTILSQVCAWLTKANDFLSLKINTALVHLTVTAVKVQPNIHLSMPLCH